MAKLNKGGSVTPKNALPTPKEIHHSLVRFSFKYLELEIDWDKTSEPKGYAHLNEQMQQCEPWQFSLAREELGRVHGLLFNDVFYVVWVDHEHKLYNGRAH